MAIEKALLATLVLTPPVKLVIDCSSDGRNAAYVGLVVDAERKPLLIHGTGRNIGTGDVEAWGVRRAIRRVNARYNGTRRLIVFTDNQAIASTRDGGRVRYQWLSRNDVLIRHLHLAANSLRRSMSG